MASLPSVMGQLSMTVRAFRSIDVNAVFGLIIDTHLRAGCLERHGHSRRKDIWWWHRIWPMLWISIPVCKSKTSTDLWVHRCCEQSMALKVHNEVVKATLNVARELI